ncbi:MAG: glycosyltransferase family 4 protein [Chloroflexota bacterium]
MSDVTTTHGWGSYSVNVIASLAELGHTFTLFVPDNSELHPDFTTHRVLPNMHPLTRFFVPKMLARTRKIRQLSAECDLIHATVELYAPLAHWIAGERPVVVTGHGSYVRYPDFRRFPVSWLYRQAYNQSALVCVSEYTAKVAKQVVPRARISVIPNAIDTDIFADIKRQPAERPTVVTLGGVKARKGTLALVEAMAVVREQIPDVQCIIMGSTTVEPAYTAQVQDAITRHGLENTVQLTGFIDEATLRDWYAKAHVFALPSLNAGWKFEGFGLSTLEASAAGIPVIGTRDCGAENAIDHNVTGLLVSQTNIADELPVALVRLLTDRDLAQRIGIAGRKKALSHTWQDVGIQLDNLYYELTGVTDR